MPLLLSRALTNTAAEHLADHNQIHPKLNHVLDVVSDFGADNTGTSDATAALQAAITYQQDNGGTVFAPAGTYLISTPPLKCVPTSGDATRPCIIRGAG